MSRLIAMIAVLLLAAASPAGAQPLVSPDWLRSRLAQPDVLVLDIRPVEQHASGHIPTALSASFETAGWRVKQADGAAGALPPLEQVAAMIGSLGVGEQTHVVIAGNDFAAEARIYWTFKVLGHDIVSILDGGQKAWLAAGGPLDTARVTPRPARFTARYQPGLRAQLADVEQAVARGDEALVDARPPAQWTGKAKSPVVQSFGHLPGAVWIDQSEALTPDGTALKPVPELATLFVKVGDGPVTTYCNTGHMSSTDWFVLSEVLHHPQTRMYDGSMSQWTSDPARPVEK